MLVQVLSGELDGNNSLAAILPARERGEALVQLGMQVQLMLFIRILASWISMIQNMY